MKLSLSMVIKNSFNLFQLYTYICNIFTHIFAIPCVPFFIRFKNVTFDIVSTEDVGIFDVRSKFLGVDMEKVQLNIQVS